MKIVQDVGIVKDVRIVDYVGINKGMNIKDVWMVDFGQYVNLLCYFIKWPIH